MGSALDLLHQRCQDSWQLEPGQSAFGDRAWGYYRQIEQLRRSSQLPHIFLADADPEVFLAGFVAACAANCQVTLGNPNWTPTEHSQGIDLVQPTAILTQGEIQPLALSKINSAKIDSADSHPEPDSHPELSETRNFVPRRDTASILIPTGGSSGHLRFVHHTWNTLIASVQGFQQHFQCDSINCLCILPIHHVSGLMQFMRAFASGGKIWIRKSATFLDHLGTAQLKNLADLNPAETFISLVPTQLQRLLAQPPAASAWLAQFQTVLLGGAPAWSALLNQAQAAQIPIALTYGMTETASQVATLHPAEFLAGDRSCGPALPHAAIEIWDDRDHPLPPGQPGQIIIRAKSQALGYIPPFSGSLSLNTQTPELQARNRSPLRTADWGWLDDRGYLHIGGRRDRAILTGGETVFPEEVEAAIRSTKLVQDICILGLPDPQWGERVVAAYVPIPKVSEFQISQAIARQLSRFKQPKQWLALSTLPRNAQGKLNLDQLKRYCLGSQ